MNFQPGKILLYVAAVLLCLAACQSKQSSSPESQNDDDYHVAVLINSLYTDAFNGLRDELKKMGYISGENIHYYTEYQVSTVLDLVDPAEIDVYIIIPGDLTTVNFVEDLRQQVPPDKPIIFIASTIDPISAGYADSLLKPGQNVSGVMLAAGDERRFVLFQQLDPTMQRVLFIYNAKSVNVARQVAAIQAIAASEGIELVTVEAPDDDRAATQALIDSLEAEMDGFDGIFMLKIWLSNETWQEVAIRHKLPVSHDNIINYFAYRPLMVYGPMDVSLGQQAAHLVQQVLQNHPIGDLPIENSEVFLTIDQAVADAIDLDIPETLLAQAHQVINTPLVFSQLGGGACTLTFNSPLGSQDACFDTTCEQLPVLPWVSYDNQQDVSACPVEKLTGICLTTTYSLYLYAGDADTIATNCTLGGGVWQSGLSGLATQAAPSSFIGG